MTDWNRRFLDLAEHISNWSKDPSRKIGAVIVNSDRQILSVGYNGFPRGIKDLNERLQDRDIKYSLIVHAEMNAIYNATHNGISLKDSILFVTGLPVCSDCARGIIQVGIKTVIMPYEVYTEMSANIDSKWTNSWLLTEKMFIEAGIKWLFL
jgi:dCMP deaminase